MCTTGHPVVSKMTSSLVPYCHESHAFHSLASPWALVISVKRVALLMTLMSLTFNFSFTFDIIMLVNVSEPLIVHSFFQQHINIVPVTWCLMSRSPKSRDALRPSWHLSSSFEISVAHWIWPYFICLFILSSGTGVIFCRSAVHVILHKWKELACVHPSSGSYKHTALLLSPYQSCLPCQPGG